MAALDVADGACFCLLRSMSTETLKVHFVNPSPVQQETDATLLDVGPAGPSYYAHLQLHKAQSPILSFLSVISARSRGPSSAGGRVSE